MTIERIPLVVDIETRDGTVRKDSLSTNGYYDMQGKNPVFIKRPGFSVRLALPPGPAQGLLWLPDGSFLAVVNKILYHISNMNVVSVLYTFISDNQFCYMSVTYNQLYVFLQNIHNLFLINLTTFAITEYDPTSVISVDGLINPGQGYYGSWELQVVPNVNQNLNLNPVTITAQGTPTFDSNGTIIETTITTVGSGYTLVPTATLVPVPGGNATGPSNTAVLTVVLNAPPAGPFVPGVVYMDGYIIVGTEAGQLWNTGGDDATTDVTSFSALAYISVNNMPVKLIGITRHLNYLVAFTSFGVDFFYVNGAFSSFPDSALACATSYHQDIGCVNGNSIASHDGVVIWLAQSVTSGISIQMMAGLIPQVISTPYICNILNNSNLFNVFSYICKIDNHEFYILTLIDTEKTLVYDITTKKWHMWSSIDILGKLRAFSPAWWANSYSVPNFDSSRGFGLDIDNGSLYSIDSNLYTDNDLSIICTVRTELIDNNTSQRKFIHSIQLIGDKGPGVATIVYTDNDYTTWSSLRELDLSQERSIAFQLGSTRRRAWEITHQGNSPWRAQALEISFELGDMNN